ncbi:hypothetical protein EVAR_5842_1 [Eumeta japonica]|uniref:Uncharacterized protein n=1 Tax=Eumeta variegata TaxID=151549 RepID=A0A4C1TCR7_EUMVA|nr:hypothetical protein EVAR_5842_1 [Eumeta japonica]
MSRLYRQDTALTEHRRKVAASAVAFSVNWDILFPLKEPGDALVTSLGLQVTMGGYDHLFSGGSHALLPLENTIHKRERLINRRPAATHTRACVRAPSKGAAVPGRDRSH